MSERALQTIEQTKKEINEVYSRNVSPLKKMIIGLHKEFKEMLGPGETVNLYFRKSPDSRYLDSCECSKDGIKLKDGHVISPEQYVERAIQYEKNDRERFSELHMLLDWIRCLEKERNKKLTGKYFREVEKQDASS